MVKKVFAFQDKDGKLIESKYSNSTRYINVKIGENGMAKIRRKDALLESNRKLPELYLNKNECCGCTACYCICPQNGKESDIVFEFQFIRDGDTREIPFSGAISMIPDEEGFLYPVIDAEKCIRCYKCLRVCPYKN